jgi:branched-chain amino acid transport system ATP-binding protein
MAVLEARQLDVRFGEHHAVRDVSLAADAGEIVGLIGPNGAGKTTTFNAIAGVQRCTGQVLLDGTDVSSVRPHRRARLGLNRTFQRLEVFGSMTAHENVVAAVETRARAQRRSMRGAGAEAERLLEHVGLADVGDRRADALPTGQARLVELARALATEPRVLLLDEPASGLDEHETVRLAGVLAALRDEGMAILMVEHDIDLVMELCTRICVLDLGELIATGSPEEIRHDPRVRDAYLGTTV